MKARADLEPKSPTVLSSPNDYYVDTLGRVNELEDDDERILFGTVANPITVVHPVDDMEEIILEARVDGDPQADLLAQCALDTHKAMNPKTNPHLMMMDALFGALETTKK